jgi:DNA-binding response OmpR family regulator
MRLLLVEDNEELAQLLSRRVQAAGYEADLLATAADALTAVMTTRYAAMILDLGLPDGDGLAILREMRQREDPLPVLVLTARGGLQDRVSGLRSGADDYLVKPFAFEELIARLEALLRRPGQLLGRSLQIANLAFDTEGRQAFIDDEPQVLSASEMTLLELLMRRKDRVVAKRLVEDTIFGSSRDVASNAVEVSIHRLRKQLSGRLGRSASVMIRLRCNVADGLPVTISPLFGPLATLRCHARSRRDHADRVGVTRRQTTAPRPGVRRTGPGPAAIAESRRTATRVR